jgi:hypothetical protein
LHGDAQIWVNFMGFPHGWPSQYWKDIRHSKVWSSLWIGDPNFNPYHYHPLPSYTPWPSLAHWSNFLRRGSALN